MLKFDKQENITPIGQNVFPSNFTEPAQTSYQLTMREAEVLTWVAMGKSNMAIAVILGISTHTVDTYVRRVMKKFGVASRTTAAVRASQHGLLPRI